MLGYSILTLDQRLTTEELIDRLSGQKMIFFLDSANSQAVEVTNNENIHLQSKSRFSYIGINPLRNFSYWNCQNQSEANNALKQLDRFLVNKITPFGLFSESLSSDLERRIKPQYYFFASYNFGEILTNISNPKLDLQSLPDLFCVLCADQWIFDHLNEKIYYIYLSEKEIKSDELSKRCSQFFSSKMSKNDHVICSEPKANFTYEEYLATIDRIKAYIYDGHIYQVNLSQIFSFSSHGDYWSLYKKIRKSNAAPFCSFFKLKDCGILSTSPERFLAKQGQRMITEPIKGTRPRDNNPQKDWQNKTELLGSIKERSENIMIVDLLRNDLGRICKYGTVEVEDLLYIEKYPSVFQLVSRVGGELKEGLSFGEILAETFPGGSITGCPKVRAMEIIAELERNKRSVYTGTLGRIAIDLEDFDLSIVIRTILVEGDRAQLSLGGGIVYDSQKKREYQETLDKGAAIVRGLNS